MFLHFLLGKNELKTSCRGAILSLLSKGDLGLLKNWRPVALLCTDYKILATVRVSQIV